MCVIHGMNQCVTQRSTLNCKLQARKSAALDNRTSNSTLTKPNKMQPTFAGCRQMYSAAAAASSECAATSSLFLQPTAPPCTQQTHSRRLQR